MMQLLQHQQIQKDKWDRLVEQSQTPLIYGLSWYLDIVAPNWCAIVNNDYSIGFPIFIKKKLFIPYAVQPAWTQQLGFFATCPLTPEIIHQTLNILHNSIFWCSIRCNNAIQNIRDPRFQIIQHNNFELTMNSSFENLWTNFAKNLKRNLIKTSSLENNIAPTEQFDQIIDLFRDNRGKYVGYLKEKHYNTLRILLQEALHRKMVKAYGLFDNKARMRAGVIFLTFAKRAIMLFSGVDYQYRQYNPLHNLMVHFIRQHCGNYQILDFEGSDDPNLARFFAQFGATNNPYFELYFSKFPVPQRFLNLVRKIF